jgi:hypothetical protein
MEESFREVVIYLPETKTIDLLVAGQASFGVPRSQYTTPLAIAAPPATEDFGPLDPGFNSSGATRGVLETGCICESPVSSNITTFGAHPNMHRSVSVGGGSANYLKKKRESNRSD